MTALSGHCLCGDVRISVAKADAHVSGCHCAMCRRWTGGVQFGFAAAPADVTVSGDVARYQSSTFAERAFCPRCGSHLWLRDSGEDYEFVPGIFEGAKDFPLVREVYADRAFAYAHLAGDHPKISRADYEASNPFVEGDMP